ncbi:MAG: heavy metal translocating P-type ATPase [Pseudomonadota bacterium]
MSCCGTATTSTDEIAQKHGLQQRMLEEEVRAASHPVDDTLVQTVFVVPDMHCVACISTIENTLNALPFVNRARANLSTRRVSVDWNGENGSAAKLSTALDTTGFSHTVLGEEPVESSVSKTGRELLLALAVAGFAAANIMLLSVSVWSGADVETAKLFHLISGLIAVPAVAIAGRPFFSSALSALSRRRLNMDVPISLAVLMALGMGLYESFNAGQEAYFDACTMLLFFLLIGRYLDHLMREKAHGSIESLARLTARGGLIINDDGSLDYIAQRDIQPGMKLRVLPGERFPVNGRITRGTSDVDRSLVSGESAAIAVEPGRELEAGTLNLTGSIDIVATSDAETSFLADVMTMMDAAQNGRGAYVRLAEKFASIYAPAVHLLALVTFIAWMVASGGAWQPSLYAAIAVLIITCPCALGLAVPVVHVVGANRLFQQGILMRDGSGLERLATVDHVAFDKTGTLTLGEPRLEDLPDVDRKSQPLIAALAANSTHPIARQLRDLFEGTTATLDDVTDKPGFGVEALLNGKRLRLGRPDWVAELCAPAHAMDKEATSGFCLEGGEPVWFRFNDALRPDAKDAVRALRNAGVGVEILSGDRTRSVLDVANALGISDYQSEIVPKDKIDRLHALQEGGQTVLMVGDGLNDAPALAAANVSMAPASASEAGRLASDFVFTREQLSAVPFTLRLARATTRLVRQNFAIAILYNVVAVPLAMAGFVTPLIAAIAMSASSITVVANAMRLNWMGFGSDTRSAAQLAERVQTPRNMQQASLKPVKS